MNVSDHRQETCRIEYLLILKCLLSFIWKSYFSLKNFEFQYKKINQTCQMPTFQDKKKMKTARHIANVKQSFLCFDKVRNTFMKQFNIFYYLTFNSLSAELNLGLSYRIICDAHVSISKFHGWKWNMRKIIVIITHSNYNYQKVNVEIPLQRYLCQKLSEDACGKSDVANDSYSRTVVSLLLHSLGKDTMV